MINYTETGDVAVHADIVEAALLGVGLTRILLSVIVHGEDFLLSKGSAVVEIQFGVNAKY